MLIKVHNLVDHSPSNACSLTTDLEVIFPWTPMGDSSTDARNRFHVPPISPREALQPTIDNFRCLRWMNVPLYGDENHELVEDIFDRGQENSDFGNDEQQNTYDHERRLWEAQRGLKDVYLECGWDVEAEEQTTFRRDEFLEKRRSYLKDVLGSLDGWAGDSV